MKTLFKFLVVIFVAAAINVAATSCIAKGDPKKAAQMEQLDSLANQVVYEIYGGMGKKPASVNHIPLWQAEKTIEDARNKDNFDDTVGAGNSYCEYICLKIRIEKEYGF